VHSTHKIELDKLSYAPRVDVLQAAQKRAWGVGGLFGILTIIAFVIDYKSALQAYLPAFLMFLGLTLGPMAWVLVWFMPGGRWGMPMRRIWEAASRNIWVAALLFIPIAAGYKAIFPWAMPGHEEYTGFTGMWLNFPAFLIRAVIYFAVWGFVAYRLNSLSAIQDKPHDWLYGKLKFLGAAGLLAYIWALTFASIDWMMSLRPAWPSTIFPLIVLIGQAILGLSVGFIMIRILIPYEPLNVLADDVVRHDNGKLLLACVMLWAYFSYSQWLIIWSGNLPEEIHWFLPRVTHGWGGVALLLVIGHFAIPFAILLSRGFKKSPAKMAWLAAWMIFMRFIDLFWESAPTWSPDGINWAKVWMYPVITLFMLGLWGALFLRQVMRRPLIPAHDPRLIELYGDVHE
jgi:hypothetical protein